MKLNLRDANDWNTDMELGTHLLNPSMFILFEHMNKIKSGKSRDNILYVYVNASDRELINKVRYVVEEEVEGEKIRLSIQKDDVK